MPAGAVLYRESQPARQIGGTAPLPRPYLKKYYEKIKNRRGTGKAIVTLARKFLGIIYRTLKNNWVFEDTPNFVLAKPAS